ncbi:hypothetical protein SAMN05216480_11526 [Pustulibacterium marinum]|uniref:DUF6787 domain-containing protein n=1 Tax=Pustulibacterium marinum TaxID=1224947 RepID=A0A1I7IDK5_9FLAO|nr:DUF6787 family protein [Pustulibacterium marinum]SFU70930.1 hypothetical protein SAMN05216480_11526 [Pustulibacterium marinum]
MKKLKQRWNVTSNFQLTLIFIVFAITGSTSAYIIRPILHALGFSKTFFGDIWYAKVLYIIVEIIAILPIYFPLLLLVGTVFGQFKFFWNFEKKTFSRFIKKKK